eukprot:COSAG06_NODE_67856_length_251_cov_0.296053_1_plen_71_part_01
MVMKNDHLPRQARDKHREKGKRVVKGKSVRHSVDLDSGRVIEKRKTGRPVLFQHGDSHPGLILGRLRLCET